MTAVLAALPEAVAQTELLQSTLRRGANGSKLNGLAACIVPFLSALKWRGSSERLVEALPHFISDVDIDDFRDVLASLGFPTRCFEIRASQVDERMMPCVYETHRGAHYVLLERIGHQFRVFDPTTGGEYTLNPKYWRGRAYVPEFNEIARSTRIPETSGHWFRSILRRFRSVFAMLFAITMVINLFALIVPVTVMVIYDQVIGQRNGTFLPYICGAVLVSIIVEIALRTVRTRAQAYLSARLEFLIGTKAFGHILHLPYSLVERAAVGKQLARIKEFESLRDLFTGPLVSVLLDLPFITIFILAIALLSGPAALVSVFLIGAYIVLGAILFPIMRQRVKVASAERAQRHAFIVETVGEMRSIKLVGGEDIWHSRFRKFSSDATYAGFRANFLTSVVQTLSHMLMVIAGVGVLAISVERIEGNTMSMGALIATMALTWRVLAPIQTGFNLVARFEQVVLSIRQLEELLKFRKEREPGKQIGEKKVFEGNLKFDRISLRYLPLHEPALLGVSFAVGRGEIVALVGPSGSGKSSLLNVALRLYEPQGGTVTLDGIDVRQLDPVELRRAISYVPQRSQDFYGTIAQNLRFGNLAAADLDLKRACAKAGLLEEIESLREGFETRIGDNRSLSLPAGFHQRLGLARAYLSEAPVLMFDEPANALDEAGDRLFREAINSMRGERTVLLATHRPSHMRLADKIIAMSNGEIVAVGTPDEVIPKLTGQLF